MVDRETNHGARASLIRYDAGVHARRRLYCVPFAGGGPSTYRLWPKCLPADVEVVAVVIPGRDPRVRAASGEPVPASMAELIGPCVAVIAEMQAADPLPFAFFGHSMGALVAYELTVAMEAAAMDAPRRPSHLFVSGRRAPDERHEGKVIHGLPDDEFLDAMQRRYNAVPDAVRREPELLALFLPGLRADVQVFETYAPLTDRRVQCPVRVYGGADDHQPTPDALPGWQRVAEREVSVRVFPGGHFYLNDEREGLAADVAAPWAELAAGAALGAREDG
jgi:surfactin synthase thioesterase subunit